MKAISIMSKSVVFMAILACLVAVGSGSAYAQLVYRNDNAQTFTNTCANGVGCADWNETVSIPEPASLAPIVVTWSARYFVNTADIYYVGLNVNGTGCQTGVYGPDNLEDIATNPKGHFLTVTFQWIVEPSDGVLIKSATNTFELCGGGDGSVAGDNINISQNTLTVAKN
jgi:hypothetical protein